jgi:DNA-binding SARP family transcriptional activator
VLLAFLLLQRHRTHPRATLTDLFWQDVSQDQARSCLSTALWRLRGALEPEGVPHGTYLVNTPAGEVGFNAQSDYWLDVALLEEAVTRVHAQPIQAVGEADAQALVHALHLYCGDLLEGHYSDWVLRERERVRCLYLDGLKHLMYYYSYHRAFAAGIACGRQILALDPLQEEIHGELMRLYLENGQRAAALQQYEGCRSILATELGISPVAEIQTLASHIVAASNESREHSVIPWKPVTMQQVAHHLGLAACSFDRARNHMQQALQLIEHASEYANAILLEDRLIPSKPGYIRSNDARDSSTRCTREDGAR